MTDDAPGSQRALRRSNTRLVLQALRANGPLSHAQLARRTGLSRASVTNIVRELGAEGRVAVNAEVRSGRNARVVSVVPRSGLVSCINVGRTHLRVSLADLEQNVVSEDEVVLEENHLPSHSISTTVGMLRLQVTAAGASMSQLRGVVIGAPGPLDSATRRVEPGSLMPRWVAVDLGAAFHEQLQVPVLVENDANLGALGEFRCGQYGREVQNLVYIRITSGIGAGLILGGRLHHGASGVAGEIGHTVVESNGPLCRCGNRGCLERYAVAPSMLDLDRVNRGALNTVDDLIRLAIEGEITCRRVIEDRARHLGTAVANLCNTINPDVVVFAGPLTAVGDLLLDPVREVVDRRAVPSAARVVRISAARFDRRAEVLGGLALAVDTFAQDSPADIS